MRGVISMMMIIMFCWSVRSSRLGERAWEREMRMTMTRKEKYNVHWIRRPLGAFWALWMQRLRGLIPRGRSSLEAKPTFPKLEHADTVEIRRVIDRWIAILSPLWKWTMSKNLKEPEELEAKYLTYLFIEWKYPGWISMAVNTYNERSGEFWRVVEVVSLAIAAKLFSPIYSMRIRIRNVNRSRTDVAILRKGKRRRRRGSSSSRPFFKFWVRLALVVKRRGVQRQLTSLCFGALGVYYIDVGAILCIRPRDRKLHQSASRSAFDFEFFVG